MDIKDLIIEEDSNLISAMKALDLNSMKILYVVSSNRLVATITDGDIRRWILKKGQLDAKITEFANYTPVYLTESEMEISDEYFRNYKVDSIPIVNNQREIISVLFRDKSKITSRKSIDTPVVIMAGGLGTRLYPFTKILPKALIPINEIPITEHIINRFSAFGVSHFFMIKKKKKSMIKAYFNDYSGTASVSFIDEFEPLGTGGGLSLLKGVLNSTFVLTNCDILIDEDYEKILQYHRENRNEITIVGSLKTIKIPYGVIEISNDGLITEMREKPSYSFLANTGVYIIEPTVIDDIPENTSLGLPDICESYIKAGKKVGIFPISESKWLDMGQFDELEVMRRRIESYE